MQALKKKDIRIPSRDRDAHKGQHGRVLVVGGSEDLVGAVALAGIAALRSGCDLVVVAAPSKVAWAVNALYPDLITTKLPGKSLSMRHWPTIKKLAQRADVILVGNGIGRSWQAKRLVNKISALPNPKVVDADAIGLVRPSLLHNTILTPHAREFQEFCTNGKFTAAETTQEQLLPWLGQQNVLLLKGERDTVVSYSHVVQNTTGNPGMTKGGTGDVLAGLCAGYLAQHGDLWDAACAGAYISGAIGDLLKKKHKGYTYLASDMVAEIQKFS